MMPFFSVIIPVYNRIGRIDQAVESVLAQTFTDFELIIVDDCSTDGTWEHISKYTDPRIRVFRNERNSERCATRNRAIELSQGRYITFLDSDDHHLPHHLEALHGLISEKGFPKAFFFTNAWNEDESGKRTERCCPDFTDHDPFSYFLHYTVNPQRWAVHRDVMLAHPFDPAINICEDMDTSLRMVAAGIPVFQLKGRTTCYVAASDSFTHGASDKWERELANLQRIFARLELKGKLPAKETDRLLSMCHYHLSVKAFIKQDRAEYYRHALRSFVLYPSGYNGRTNWPLLVMGFRMIPVIGVLYK
jgi:glycosyltransferase involved in cell wall biosynthesis